MSTTRPAMSTPSGSRLRISSLASWATTRTPSGPSAAASAASTSGSATSGPPRGAQEELRPIAAPRVGRLGRPGRAPPAVTARGHRTTRGQGHHPGRRPDPVHQLLDGRHRRRDRCRHRAARGRPADPGSAHRLGAGLDRAACRRSPRRPAHRACRRAWPLEPAPRTLHLQLGEGRPGGLVVPSTEHEVVDVDVERTSRTSGIISALIRTRSAWSARFWRSFGDSASRCW